MCALQMRYPPLNVTEESLAEFWAGIAEQTIEWMKPWNTVLSGGLHHGDVRWFTAGQLNVSVNCLDRHLPHKANHVAIIWEGIQKTSRKRRLLLNYMLKSVV